MRFKKLLLISILLLFLISFGAVNASSENYNHTEIDDSCESSSNLISTNNNDDDLNCSESLIEESSNYEMESSSDEGNNVICENHDKSSKLSLSDDDLLEKKFSADLNVRTYPSFNSRQYGKPLSIMVHTGTYSNLEKNITLSFNENIYSFHLEEHLVEEKGHQYSKYYYIMNITNYTLENHVQVFYPGDDNHYNQTISQTFYTFINTKLSDNNYYGQNIPNAYLNLYNATGNLTIICNDVTSYYNLTGEPIFHEFTNYTVGINNYSIIYSGDEKYNGFLTENYFQMIYPHSPFYDYITNYVGAQYINGELVPLYINLFNATGVVTFTVNNKSYPVDLVDGVAYIEINEYEIGVNRIFVEYSGDENFKGFSRDLIDYLPFNLMAFKVNPRGDAYIYSCVIQNDDVNMILIQLICEDGMISENESIDVTINGKKSTFKLVNNTVRYDISPNDVIDGVFVDFKGNNFLKPINSTDFIMIKDEYIINNNTYMFYFNQNDGGKLFDWVPSGVTLDFQGSIIAPKDSMEISLEISKPVNVISSTGDAFVDLDTHAGSLFGEHPGACFAVTNGGSWSNITGINFHNTQIWVFNATHVVLDRISNVVEDQRVGSGVGATSIRANSTWCTVKNSYFYTRNNGGSSTLVGAWADYCTFDNNTIVTEGEVGNLIYFTTFNVDIPEGLKVNLYNNIINNKIQGRGSAICWGIVGSNANYVIENNTINMTGTGITGQWGGSYENLYSNIEGRIAGNVLLRGANMNVNGLVYNNYVTGDMSASGLVYNNTVLGVLTSSDGEVFNNVVNALTISTGEYYNNTVNGKTSVWSNASVHDNSFNDDIVIESNFDASYLNISNNNISGSIILNSKTNNVTIQNNYIKSGDEYAIDLKSSKDNIITGNIIRAKNLYGNDAVKSSDESNIIQDNGPYSPDLNITAENIYVGDSLIVKTAINKKVSGTVEVIANGKIYTVKKGKGNVNINDLAAGTYTITARYPGDDYFSPAEKSISVNVSKFSPLMEISLANATIGENVLVNISALDISGNINLIVDGQKHIVSLKNGAGSYTIKNITAGGHSIVAIYEGDTRNEAAYASANLFLKVLPTKITDIAIDDFNIKGVLRDGENHPINNATIQYTINGQPTSTLTDDNGAFSIQGLANAKVEITYAGTNALLATGTAITLSDVEPARTASIITASQLACYAVDTAAGEKGALFKVSLKDYAGNPIANASVKFALNGKIYDAASDENGTATLQVNINNANTYTCAVSYLGDDKHNASFTAAKVVVVKKKTAITAKAATYKVKTKTKKYVATLKTIKGSSANGKIYLKAGKKVTLTVNGKTYVGKTTKTGKVTFKITKLTKKGKYYAVIKFAGDNTYKATTKKIKITVK